jgi:hypothetical protein
MSNELYMRLGRKLITAEREHLTDVPAKAIAARVRIAIDHAIAAGFKFQRPISATSSMPNLIAYGQCDATYGKYRFTAEIRCWNDGEVSMYIKDDGENLFNLRVLKTGGVSQDFNFHKFLHKEAT